jgi:hypothetical protein
VVSQKRALGRELAVANPVKCSIGRERVLRRMMENKLMNRILQELVILIAKNGFEMLSYHEKA